MSGPESPSWTPWGVTECPPGYVGTYQIPLPFFFFSQKVWITAFPQKKKKKKKIGRQLDSLRELVPVHAVSGNLPYSHGQQGRIWRGFFFSCFCLHATHFFPYFPLSIITDSRSRKLSNTSGLASTFSPSPSSLCPGFTSKWTRLQYVFITPSTRFFLTLSPVTTVAGYSRGVPRLALDHLWQRALPWVGPACNRYGDARCRLCPALCNQNKSLTAKES